MGFGQNFLDPAQLAFLGAFGFVVLRPNHSNLIVQCDFSSDEFIIYSCLRIEWIL